MPDPTPHWTTTAPYTALGNAQIRLLHVQPWTDNTKDQIECTLSVHDLATAPSFRALSYTWGLPHRDIHKLRTSARSATRQINCNGKEGQVGENLYDSLLYCAHDHGSDLQGYLWIDALSINQGDDLERSEQVKLMSKVYQKAAGVTVWLGPEDDATESAMDLIRRVLELDEAERLLFNSNEVSKGHPEPLLNERKWQALSQFFQREWFKRAWM